MLVHVQDLELLPLILSVEVAVVAVAAPAIQEAAVDILIDILLRARLNLISY